MITLDEAIETIKAVQAENTVSIVRHNALADVIDLLQSEKENDGYRAPKKIIKMLSTNRIGIEELCYDCPTCRGSANYIGKPISYCKWCGQALDWHSEDEE